MWFVWQVFTERWLKRAERDNDCALDDGDRFIALWIAFNGWMRGKFGENLNDKAQIDKVKDMPDFRKVFQDLRKNDIEFQKNLNILESISVINMKHYNGTERVYEYNGTFAQLMDVLYQIRCNLFHGRKDIEADKKDIELVSLAYKILLLLFKNYLKENPL